jgi:membrane fusion protein (multidrug efflux system)
MASKKIYTIVAVAGILTASSVAWWYQNANKSPMGITVPAGAGGRAVGVELVNVKKMLLRDDAEAVGTLRSRQNVMMRPEVAGRILALGFGDGTRVNVGQVLVQLDDTLQRAEVQQSLAQLSIAKANHKRNQELVAQNFVAQRVLDESAASLQVSEAQVSLSCARLERMRIVAPFSGVVGIRNINVGDFVKDGADLINLEDIGMLYVDYRLPERYQAKLSPGQVVELKIDALPGRLFKAKVEALDPLIEPNGRSIGMRAVLANGPGEPVAPPGGKKPDGSAAPGGPAKPGAPTGAASAPNGAASAPAQPSNKNPQTSNPAKVADGKSNKSANNAGAGNGPVSGSFNLPSPQSIGCPPNQFDRARVAPSGSNTTGPLRPGMFARVSAVFAVKPDALVVPEEAIVPQGGKQFVIRAIPPSELPAQPASATASAPEIPPGTLYVSKRVEVKLGIRRGGQVEVTEGLNEGEPVVVAGQQRLQKDGTPLRVVELGKPPAAAASSASAPSSGGASAPMVDSPASSASR